MTHSTYPSLSAAFNAMGAAAFRAAVEGGSVTVEGTTVHAGRRVQKMAPVTVERHGYPGCPRGAFTAPQVDSDINFRLRCVRVDAPAPDHE